MNQTIVAQQLRCENCGGKIDIATGVCQSCGTNHIVKKDISPDTQDRLYEDTEIRVTPTLPKGNSLTKITASMRVPSYALSDESEVYGIYHKLIEAMIPELVHHMYLRVGFEDPVTMRTLVQVELNLENLNNERYH